MPFTTAAIIAGTGIAAYGTIQAGKEAEQLGETQRAIHEYNRALDIRQAQERLDVGVAEESRFRTAGEKLKARQRAGYAKAGVTIEGSPMDQLEETAIQLESGALTIRRNAAVGAADLMASAELSRVAGRSALTRGRAARRASYLKAAGIGLSGLGSAALLAPNSSGQLTSEGRATLLRY